MLKKFMKFLKRAMCSIRPPEFVFYSDSSRSSHLSDKYSRLKVKDFFFSNGKKT